MAPASAAWRYSGISRRDQGFGGKYRESLEGVFRLLVRPDRTPETAGCRRLRHFGLEPSSFFLVFDLLRAQQEEIESEIGCWLSWEELPKARRVAVYTAWKNRGSAGASQPDAGLGGRSVGLVCKGISSPSSGFA